MRALAAFILIVSVATEAKPSAQAHRMGVKSGLNSSTFTGDIYDASKLTKSARLSWRGGAFLISSLSPHVALQLEALYSREGFSAQGQLYGFGAMPIGPRVTTVTIHVLELPVLFRVEPRPSGRLNPYLIAGPGVGFLLSGRRIIPGYADFSLSDVLSQVDSRAVVGGGITLSHVLIEARFTQGLTGETQVIPGASPTRLLQKTAHRAQVVSVLMGVHF
jgi:hypothetical protein